MIANIDCLVKILSHLSVRDRYNCRRVNTIWKQSSDHLSLAQKRLVLVSKYQSYRLKYEDSNDTIVWTTSYVKYNTYLDLISQFPNLRCLAFVGFDYWNDSLINHMVLSCPALTSLEFIACDGLGRNRNDDFYYMNVTDNGWRQLVTAFGNQLSKLVISDCDLNEKQLDILVNGFRRLIVLDIRGNHIKNFEPLIRLCETIQVIKLGPRLINGENISIDLPLNSLMTGSGRQIKELHIQGFLTRQLSNILSFTQLNRLVVKFIRPLFSVDQDLEFFTSISAIKNLECLELYEYNSHDGIMSVTYNQLNALIRNCGHLKKLVISCDNWCDSIICDSILRLISQYNKQLVHLSLCPGSFEATDSGLEWLSKLPDLESVLFTGFPAFTELGFIKFIENTPKLNSCFIEDCFVITQAFIDCLIVIFKENPKRYMNFQLSDSKITGEIPKQLPTNLKISLNKQKDYSTKQQNMNSSPNGSLWQTFVSIITYISGLSAITITLFIFLLHFILTKLFSKLSFILITSVFTTIFIIPYYLANTILTNVLKIFLNISFISNTYNNSEEEF